MIRPCEEADNHTIYEIINQSAQVYKNVIPDDRWHEPYMPLEELRHEIRDGVVFWCLEQEGEILGVMGIQDKGEVTLIRHAYVRPQVQKMGIGTQLLRHMEGLTAKPILMTATIRISGLNHKACFLDPFGFGLPLPELPAKFTTDPLARL